jgi:hypothetical protein
VRATAEIHDYHDTATGVLAERRRQPENGDLGCLA